MNDGNAIQGGLRRRLRYKMPSIEKCLKEFASHSDQSRFVRMPLMSERDELDAFGRLLMRDVRDRAIRELFGQLTDGGAGLLPGELLQQISSADGPAVRNLIVKAVDESIENFLLFMDHMNNGLWGMDPFAMSGQSGTSLASIGDEFFPSERWVERYSELPEKEAGDDYGR
jgi:hypothetical protein